MESGKEANRSLYFLYISDTRELGAAYMPAMKNGGLFIPGSSHHALGDRVFLLIRLPDEPSRLAACGTVTWITPAKAQGNLVEGIGVRFDDGENRIRGRIERYLADLDREETGLLTM